MNMHEPLHPGEVVREILIEGADLTITDAACYLDVSRASLSRLLNGHVGLSPEMAIRLAKLLINTDSLFWMNLQRDYEMACAEKHSKHIHVKPLKKAA